MQSTTPPFASDSVAMAFAKFPEAERAGLLALRALIFEVAQATPGVGTLEECLKWGQPAYLTNATKAGSTLRLGCPKGGGIALFAHCQTTIISDFASLFPGKFQISGNRAVLFDAGAELPLDDLRLLIAAGLTYHMRKA